MNIVYVRAPNPGPFTLDGTDSWVIDGEAVIDPGPAIDSHIDALLAAAPDLRRIFVTHRHGDHAPAAVELRRRSGARLIAPAGVLVDSSDEIASDGRIDIFGEGTLTTIATPGHTAEHVCYLTSDGGLFTGDTILGAGTTAIFPPDGRMGDYLASLEKLRDLAPRRIYPGHGPMLDDAVSVIQRYIEHRHEREEQIVEALRSGALTLPELRARVYPDLGPGLELAAEAQLQAHLIHLEELGRVQRGDKYELVRPAK